MNRHTIMATAVTLVLLAGTAPVMAGAPEPALPVSDGWRAPEEGRPDEGKPQQVGRCPAGSTRMSSDGVLELTGPDRLGSVPGPVLEVPTRPASSGPCLADLSLQLTVESPNDKKPDGADGALDSILVPRTSLESGFEVTLPAQDRLITLSDPGENWELKSTSCSCSGWTQMSASVGSAFVSAPEAASSYPAPVLPESFFTRRSGNCVGVVPTGIVLAQASSGLSLAAGATTTSYPAPALPVAALAKAPRVEWDAQGTVTITDPDEVGGTFSCVWTVELRYGRLDLETVTKPSGEESRFSYDVVPTGGQPDASALTMRGGDSEKLHLGPWSVDVTDLPEGWKVKRSRCQESDSTTLSLASGASANVGLDGDDRVTCRFELELLAPKPGRWSANNKRGTVVCSKGDFAIPFDLNQVVDFGRLAVRDEGDTLVARGGGNSFTLTRDRDDPLDYRGTKRFSQAGFTLDFDLRLNLRSEKRMTGTLRAKAKGQGMTCNLKRPITLTHAGG